ncbi:MAG TPA: copper resistance protein CopC, partial [Steroidobacteraceae bacterium]
MRYVRVVSGLVLAFAATMVWAHAHLKKAVPADGAVVGTPPATVVLSFSEPATLTACWLQKGAGPKQKI